MRDFECDTCYGALPGFPYHGEQGTYCSQHCRDEAGDTETSEQHEVTI